MELCEILGHEWSYKELTNLYVRVVVRCKMCYAEYVYTLLGYGEELVYDLKTTSWTNVDYLKDDRRTVVATFIDRAREVMMGLSIQYPHKFTRQQMMALNERVRTRALPRGI